MLKPKAKKLKDKPLKTVYKSLYSKDDMKIVSDYELENFKWKYVSAKDKK